MGARFVVLRVEGFRICRLHGVHRIFSALRFWRVGFLGFRVSRAQGFWVAGEADQGYVNIDFRASFQECRSLHSVQDLPQQRARFTDMRVPKPICVVGKS